MSKIQKSQISTINDLHATIEDQLKTSLQLAIELGAHLTEVKNSLKYGELSKWVEDNLTFKVRTAQRYMRLFENKEKFNEIGGITAAYKVLNASRVTYLEQGTSLFDRAVQLLTSNIRALKEEDPIKADDEGWNYLFAEWEERLDSVNSPEEIQELFHKIVAIERLSGIINVRCQKNLIKATDEFVCLSDRLAERIQQHKLEMPPKVFLQYQEALVEQGLSKGFDALKKIEELGLRTEKHDVLYELMEDQSICDGNEQH